MLPSTIEELDSVKKECLRMSHKRAFLSAAASVVPLPLTDVAADVLLKRVMPKINEKFGLSKEQIDEYNPQVAILIYDISKRFGRNMVGRFVTKELAVRMCKKMGIRLTVKETAKYVPFLGQVLSAAISFTAMQLIVRAHINECYTVAKTVLEASDRGRAT